MYVTNNIGSLLKVVRVCEKIASLMVGKCKHYVRECATAGAGSRVGLCESRFLLLQYSVEYLIEYSSTQQGKLVSKRIYIRRQKARKKIIEYVLQLKNKAQASYSSSKLEQLDNLAHP